MLPILVALMVQPGPVIAPRHPHAASPWVQSVRASCRRDVLTIDGYGGGRPLDRVPTLRVNGRPVTGGAVGQLVDDLSNKRAAYRLAILCGDAGEMGLRISEGEQLLDGPVRYRSGAAFIRGNRLQSYTGLQDANADSFWFR